MESNTSREHPSPDHALRVLVRIDTQLRLACLEVRGCLTLATYPDLMNILTHTGTLGAAVSVNLLRAAHLDPDALELLRDGADAAAGAGPGSGALAAGPGDGWASPPGSVPDSPVPVEILAPRELPVCRHSPDTALPSDRRQEPGHPLTNEEAADLAFLRRDPRVLPRGQGGGPRSQPY